MKRFFPAHIGVFLAARRNIFADSEAESRFLRFTVICCIGFLVMIAFGVHNYMRGQYVICQLLFLSAFCQSCGWLLLFHGRMEKLVYRGNCLIFCLILGYLTFLGGEDHSVIFWLSTAPLIIFMVLGSTEGLVWVSSLWLALAGYFSFSIYLHGAHIYPFPFVIRFLVSFSVIFICAYFYEEFRQKSRTHLEEKNTLLQAEIAERLRIEKSLRESEERYRAIYLHAAEGILLISFGGKIVECNPQILQILGYLEVSLIGRNIFTLFHPDDLQRVPSQLDKLRAGEIVFVERHLRTAAGTYLLFEQSGKKINDDLIILLYRDITERKIAEMALERANQALDQLAHIDGLTQVANRRKFDQVLQSEWQRTRREGKVLGVVLGDIDFFKQFNDIYGHQTGDDCLRSVAQVLSRQIRRPADLVARYGGEEFVMLLPDTSYEGCQQIAEKARKEIEVLRIPHSGSTVQPVVTMSFGVAAGTANDMEKPADLVETADKALYRAKNAGRNRVC
ncbi:MAG: diguanylate cyclase [Desulforhopalus sp.]|nr:diguanylate cyclase [Desulforhopalus sp.]